MSDGIFDGLKVIDCASWIAGPAAATILSDFGAEVIKIEPPGAGDPWRGVGAGARQDHRLLVAAHRPQQEKPRHRPQAPEGLAVLYRLIASADVFITNFPLPVRERLKIAAEDLLAINPRLIYGSMTAYGEGGRGGGHGRVRRHGLLGAHRPDGHGARRPPRPSRRAPCRAWAIIRPRPALYAAIVTALYRREKTGRGGVAQSSLLQNGLWANGCYVQNRLFGEHVEHRPPAGRDAERACQPLSLPRRPLVPDGAAQ